MRPFSGIRIVGVPYPVLRESIPGRAWDPDDDHMIMQWRQPPGVDWRGYPIRPPELSAGPPRYVECISFAREGTLRVGYGIAVHEIGQPTVRFDADGARYLGRGSKAMVPLKSILEPERLDPAELLAGL